MNRMKSENARHRLMAVLFIVFSVCVLGACRKSTDQVPIGHVGMEFRISLGEIESTDDSGNPSRFHLSGDLFVIVDGRMEKLRLAKNERLTISDGVNEYNLYSHTDMFANHGFFYFPDSEPFQRAAPHYILRYYRRDRALLESRIETPALPDFVAPAIDSEWLPREQVLRVAWTQASVPVQEVVLDSRCRVSNEHGETVMHFPASDLTQLDIDLTNAPHKEGCGTHFTYIKLMQVPVSASSIDSRFLAESRFELQRRRVRSIKERT